MPVLVAGVMPRTEHHTSTGIAQHHSKDQ